MKIKLGFTLFIFSSVNPSSTAVLEHADYITATSKSIVLGNFKKTIHKKMQSFNLILDLFILIYFFIVLEHQLAKLARLCCQNT